MTLSELRVGMRLHLKGYSGDLRATTPVMLVLAHDRVEKVQVTWLDKTGVPHEHWYPIECLMLAE